VVLALWLQVNASERLYDGNMFDGRVLDVGFPDHYAPPLDHLWMICRSMDAWLAADAKNVVAVHCKAGKVMGVHSLSLVEALAAHGASCVAAC
jgi:hypothetical protein